MLRVTTLTKLIYACLLVVIVAALLMPHLVVAYDEAAHITAYALLMLWPAFIIKDVRKTLVVALGMIAIGGATEYLQRYSPERTASWSDFSLNTLGVITGLATGLILKRVLPVQR